MARYKHRLDERLFYDMAGKPLYRGDFVLFSASATLMLGVVKGESPMNNFKGPMVAKLIGRGGSLNVSVLANSMFKIPHDEAVSLLTKTRLEDYHGVRPRGLQYLESVERQRKAEEAKRKTEEVKRGG